MEGQEENSSKLQARHQVTKHGLRQVEMSGLLPWTSYVVSVSARYPAGAGPRPQSFWSTVAGLYPRSKLESKVTEGLGPMVGSKLQTQAAADSLSWRSWQVETPGGENSPAPPRQAGAME